MFTEYTKEEIETPGSYSYIPATGIEELEETDGSENNTDTFIETNETTADGNHLDKYIDFQYNLEEESLW